MEEEEVGGVDLCHCTRALYHFGALFSVVLGPFAKRGITELSHLYKVAHRKFHEKTFKMDVTVAGALF